MLKYYTLLFIRNLKRQKLFSVINLLGLTAGIASTLLIYLYVQHEFSYDRFHTKANQIYRINQTFIWGDHDDNQFASLGPGVAYAIQQDIPEVKAVTRVYPPGNFLVRRTDNTRDIKAFDERGIFAVDTNFLQVFTFPLIKGDASTALKEPNSIILTSSSAAKYFGDEDPLGKFLQLGEGKEATTYAVTGVTADVPENSYITFDMLVSMNSFPRIMRSNDLWLWTMFETFVLLDERTSPEVLQAKLKPLPRKYAGTTLEQSMYQTFDEYIQSGKQWELFVQPLSSIRLHSSNIYNRLNDVGNIRIVYVLIGVEIFIILLSCINFMNLSTAQYTRRIKESSLRKILGSNKNQLALHFFTEALMFCLVAAVIGLGCTQLVLPFFNYLTSSTLSLNLFDGQVLLVLFGLVLLMSLLSGSYPAIFLSKFSPVEAMKGKLRTGKQGKLLRNGLVTFQFSISMILLVSTIVVFQQLQYLAQKDIGFNRENLLVINRAEWINDEKTFLHAIGNLKGVQEASWSSSVPPNLYDGDQFKAQGSGKVSPLNYAKSDEKFVTTLDLKILMGRNFSESVAGDKDRVILNENAVKAFGWLVNEEVIGKVVEYPGRGAYEVIGVVRDFNYWSLQSPIQPMAIFHHQSNVFSAGAKFVVLRVTAENTQDADALIAQVQQQWQKFAGDKPFQYEFVDDAFEQSLNAEKKFSQVLVIFAGLAILIACFGLLGMIIYTLEQRTKEIGIRKVIGASVVSIWTLLVKEYAYLILISIAVSIPVCIWLLQGWLEDFNYRIEMTPWAFIWAGLSILITSLTVTSYHVIKVALTNPVEVLKDE